MVVCGMSCLLLCVSFAFSWSCVMFKCVVICLERSFDLCVVVENQLKQYVYPPLPSLLYPFPYLSTLFLDSSFGDMTTEIRG